MIVVYIYNYVIYLMALHFIDAPVMADRLTSVRSSFDVSTGFGVSLGSWDLLGAQPMSWIKTKAWFWKRDIFMFQAIHLRYPRDIGIYTV